MPRALWLLMQLRLNGWFRRIGVNMRTTKGALMTVISLLVIGGWLMGAVGSALVGGRPAVDAETLEKVNRFGPLGLLAYSLIIIMTNTGQAALAFSLAEVQFLFSAPFTRRQILAYKLTVQLLLTVPFSLFMIFALRNLSGSTLSTLVAVVLISVFLQLFGLTVSFAAAALGQMAYSRVRKFVLALLAVVVLGTVAYEFAGSDKPPADILGAVQRVEQSAVLQVLLTPLRWFVRVLTARHLFPDLLQWACLAVLVDAVLLVLVFVLDASYLEASATASEKRYERLQRMRSGGMAGGATGKPGRVRFTLSMLPWWGGVGPIAWRQLAAATRGHKALMILLLMIVFGSVGPIIAYFSEGKADMSVGWSLSGMALFMSLIMSQFFAYDFRADVDRIEVLKTLPIKPWRLVLGQMVTPVLFTSAFQILIVGGLSVVFPQILPLFLSTVVLAPPVNLAMAGVDNLVFLLFPTRMVQAHGGDFSQAGRQMLLMFAKMIALNIGLGIPVGIGVLVFYLSEQNWLAAGIAAWVPCVAISLVPLPFVAWAFRRFDVSSDTPP